MDAEFAEGIEPLGQLTKARGGWALVALNMREGLHEMDQRELSALSLIRDEGAKQLGLRTGEPKAGFAFLSAGNQPRDKLSGQRFSRLEPVELRCESCCCEALEPLPDFAEQLFRLVRKENSLVWKRPHFVSLSQLATIYQVEEVRCARLGKFVSCCVPLT